MVGAYYFFGVLLVLGYVQCDVIRNVQPAVIEELRERSNNRIVGGWPAYDEQIPHQINVRMVSAIGGVNSCGGSIIHNEWVLTAAHCLANRITFVVRLGLTNLTRPDAIVETTRKYIHPEYDEIPAGVQTHDIALLGLGRYVQYTATIQPIRLQNSEQKNVNYEGEVFTVSGYGRTDDLWNGGEASEVLLWTHLRGITNEECRRWYSGSSIVQDQTICAAYYNHTSQSSCQGDSGGPLTMVDTDGKLTQVGVVSFGSSAGCNSPWPSAYVRPGHYHDWFIEVTGVNFDWLLEQSSEESNESSDESSDESSEEDSEETKFKQTILDFPEHINVVDNLLQ